MANRQPLQPSVAKVGIEQEKQQVGQVEKASLYIGNKGRAATQMGIPKRDDSLAQLRCRKTIGRKEQTHQIAAVGRLVDIAADGAPEKSACEEQQ